MPDSKFSEEEFEAKLIKELCDLYSPYYDFYKPTRPKEKDIGFDFALTTYYSKLFNGNDVWLKSIRQIFGITFSLPVRIISSFVQTKTPFFVSQRSHSNPTQWDQWGDQFYRIDISNRNQLKKLSKLEKKLQGDALVRYAAPCFHTYQELDKYFYDHMICQKTHFQSPSSMLTNQKHEDYTYRNPLQDGIAFSEPENIEVGNFLSELDESIRENGTTNILKHIDNLYTGFSSSETIYEVEETDFQKLSKDILGEFYDFEVPYGENIRVGENFAKALEIKYTCRKLNLEWFMF